MNLIINRKLQLYLVMLLTKEIITMNDLHDNVEYNHFKFEYVGPTKDVRFYRHMDTQQLLNALKNKKIST